MLVDIRGLQHPFLVVNLRGLDNTYMVPKLVYRDKRKPQLGDREESSSISSLARLLTWSQLNNDPNF